MLFVRWLDTTEAADFDRLVEEVRQRRSSSGTKVVCIALVSPASGVPDADTRARISGAIDDVWEHCSSIHVVMEGGGMRRAILRSVIAGLLLVVMRRGRSFSVLASAEEALRKAAKDAPLEIEAILAAGGRAGILSPSEARPTGS